MKSVGFLVKTIWFSQTNLVSSQPGDSYFNQLLFITHEIYNFDDGFDDVFFLISQKGLVKFDARVSPLKLKQNGISGKLRSVLSDFLKDGSRELL